MSIQIPIAYRDLLTRPINTLIVTVTPQGNPHVSVVWRLFDPPYIWISTMQDRQKYLNVKHNPKVVLLTVDPNEAYRYLEIRGVVVEIKEDIDDVLVKRITQFYIGDPFAKIFDPLRESGSGRNVCFKIEPQRVLLPRH